MMHLVPAPGHNANVRPWWRVDRERVAAAFAHQRSIDAFGHRVHTWAGALTCVCIGGPTSAVELGALPALGAFVIRFHRHWRTLPVLFLQPLMLVVLAWAGLALTSRLWTGGTLDAWTHEFGTTRFMLVAMALWPVADRRAFLLGAIALGLALGQCSQVVHAIGIALEIDALTWNRFPGRNSGWWDPVIGGSMLTAALGLHLPAALWGRGRWRALGAIGVGVTVLGILATGTRGAWLAGAALIGVGALATIARVRPVGRMVRTLGVVCTIALAGCATAWLTVGDQVRARFDAGRAEVTQALDAKQFDSDTGARLLMAWWAIEALGERPVLGVGVGGYEQWTREHVQAQTLDARRHHAHAHNGLLQVGATLGLPGLAIAITFLVLAFRGSLTRQEGDGPPGYATGPTFALLGLLLVSAFDAIHVNSQTAAVLALLTLFAMRWRPSP